MESKIFSENHHLTIQQKVKELINTQGTFLTEETINSPRAVGDAIQEIIEEHFEGILGNLCKNYASKFARRAMADLAFWDVDDFYYVVDVKTHRLDTKFNMPNLISVERLTRFYEDDTNFFVILNVDYNVYGDSLKVEDVKFVPIEYLDWQCLTIGALGWGQIQIANSNNIIVHPVKRAEWMVQFCEIMLDFYPREISKITQRLDYFQKQLGRWKTR